jgi:hypothetical protein
MIARSHETAQAIVGEGARLTHWLVGLGSAVELALLLRSTIPLFTALFAWHAAHAILATITRNAMLARFAAVSWFALALAVWGSA